MTPSSKLTFAPLYEQVKKGHFSTASLPENGGREASCPVKSHSLKNTESAKERCARPLMRLPAKKRLVRYQGKGNRCGRTRRRQFPVPLLPSQRQERKTRLPAFTKSTACGSPRRRTPNGRLSSLLRTPKSSTSTVYVCSTISRSSTNGSRYRPPVFPDFNFEFDKVPNTLYEHYQIHFGITVAHATEQIEVTMPDSGDLKRLNIERNHPLLLVTRTSFDLQDRPSNFASAGSTRATTCTAPTCAERAPSVPEPPKRFRRFFGLIY